MPNIAVVLKEEIARLARKEVKFQTDGIRKASAQRRRDVAALKREVSKLQRQVALLQGQLQNQPAAAPVAEDAGSVPRFTAKGLISQRKRLGLSAAEYGLLVEVTPQSIYNWERGKARPRKEQIARLAALRGIGKKEMKVLLDAAAKPAKAKPAKKVAKAKPVKKVAKAKPAKKAVKAKAPKAKTVKRKTTRRKGA